MDFSISFVLEISNFLVSIASSKKKSSPSSRGHGLDLPQSICDFIQNSKTLFRKLDALSKFIKILDGPVSDSLVAIHFALLGLVVVFANETGRPTSGPMPAGDCLWSTSVLLIVLYNSIYCWKSEKKAN